MPDSTPDQIEQARLQQSGRFSRDAAKKLEQGIIKIGDRDPVSGYRQAIRENGSKVTQIKYLGDVIPDDTALFGLDDNLDFGNPLQGKAILPVYPNSRPPVERLNAVDPTITNSDAVGFDPNNCRGYLKGQIFNCDPRPKPSPTPTPTPPVVTYSLFIGSASRQEGGFLLLLLPTGILHNGNYSSYSNNLLPASISDTVTNTYMISYDPINDSLIGKYAFQFGCTAEYRVEIPITTNAQAGNYNITISEDIDGGGFVDLGTYLFTSTDEIESATSIYNQVDAISGSRTLRITGSAFGGTMSFGIGAGDYRQNPDGSFYGSATSSCSIVGSITLTYRFTIVPV